jgi:hypothetical protein
LLCWWSAGGDDDDDDDDGDSDGDGDDDGLRSIGPRWVVPGRTRHDPGEAGLAGRARTPLGGEGGKGGGVRYFCSTERGAGDGVGGAQGCYSVLQCVTVCYSGVTVVSPWCYSGVTVVLRWCYGGVTLMSQWSHSSITVVLQWCYSGVFSYLEAAHQCGAHHHHGPCIVKLPW